jgi:glycosyltransferase involved in cell wall biosynthesis
VRVVIANAQTPFVRGGAEMLADSLVAALAEAGHEAELVTMPFKWYPAERIPEAMLAARLLEVGEWAGGSIDRLIGLKFPAYLMRHPDKVLWLLHQYRGAYDLWGSEIGDLFNAPDGRSLRDSIRLADNTLIAEARSVFTISQNVSDRLLRYNNIRSRPLYHPPPNAGAFRQEAAQDFLLCPGRVNPSKRQGLIVEALLLCREKVRVVFTGAVDAAEYADGLTRRCTVAGLGDRVRWSGSVDEDTKVSLYARCLGVLVPPVDEDYGYVTLEAMLSAKPVITLTDSGGPLDFVLDGETGFICPPDPSTIAQAMDRLWRERARAETLGKAGYARYRDLGLNWQGVIQDLLG